MKKIIKLLSLSIITASFISCTANQTKNQKINNGPRDYELTILFTGNTNGQFDSNYKSIGFSRVSTILNRIRKKEPKNSVIYLDGGNSFYGSELAQIDKGKTVAKVLNGMKLTATTLGENDFNYGVENIKTIETIANFKVLATNIKKRNGNDFVTPYLIKNINGTKVGILALVSPDLANTSKALNGLSIEEPIISANNAVKNLKSSGAEYIIVLSQLGTDSIHSEWEVTSLANSVPGIDLILDGNSTYPASEKLVVNNVPIIQVGENLENIGLLKIDFDAPKNDNDKVIYSLITRSDVTLPQIVKPIAKNKVITHTIKKGDTLYSLAKKYGTTVEDIVRINPDITDGKTISIGKTYKMVANNNSKISNNNSFDYTVKKGDTLYSLAKKYGTTVEDIVRINPDITDGEGIKIGVTYKIPNLTTNYDDYNNNDTSYSETQSKSPKGSIFENVEADSRINKLIDRFRK